MASKMLSTSAVARMLGVAVASVSNWIDQSQLKAGRTPGGHRRVKAEDLVVFLQRQKLPVPDALTGLISKPKVLIVDDDDEMILRLVTADIHRAHPDWLILQAKDGYTTGELIATEKPKTVVLDLFIPGIDGFEVCRRIKSRNETRDIGIVAITGKDCDETRKIIMDAGADAFLAKPFESAMLIKELEKFIG